jgi:hypothetical protein
MATSGDHRDYASFYMSLHGGPPYIIPPDVGQQVGTAAGEPDTQASLPIGFYDFTVSLSLGAGQGFDSNAGSGMVDPTVSFAPGFDATYYRLIFSDGIENSPPLSVPAPIAGRWPSRCDPRWWWPSRLVATTAEDCLISPPLINLIEVVGR